MKKILLVLSFLIIVAGFLLVGGGGNEGGAGIHFPHTPFSARPARANWFLAREAHHQFFSKKVRAFSNKGHLLLPFI